MSPFRKVILIAIACTLSASIWGQNRYALLVGIGEYPEGSGWNRIHGDNDIPIIHDCLIGQGFSEDNIFILANAAATKSNILSTFGKISSKLTKGDLVYIHFSGHGQRVTDLDGDEDDNFDEAWIPYDAKKNYEAGVYEGENHLIDDELFSILSQLRARIGVKGKLIVIADACHSGTSVRSIPNEKVFVRGTRDNFNIPGQPSATPVRREPGDWLFVAACRSIECNYEYKSPDGTYYGRLSYFIANDGRDFRKLSYSALIADWGNNIRNTAKFPQNLDAEGRPSSQNAYMF